jgi:hypothetical protein
MKKYLVIENVFEKHVLLNTYRIPCEEEEALNHMRTVSELPQIIHDVVSEITFPTGFDFIVRTCIRVA